MKEVRISDWREADPEAEEGAPQAAMQKSSYFLKICSHFQAIFGLSACRCLPGEAGLVEELDALLQAARRG